MTYFTGWDGGGTSTVIECINEHGDTLLRAGVGAFNVRSIDALHETVSQALSHMAKLPGGLATCGGLCIGGAGVSNAFIRENIKDILIKNGFDRPFRLAADYETAFYGAFEKGPGIVLISGTGAVCYGQNADGGSHRTGGWGHLIDDGGSGYVIARDALSAVVQSLDGRKPHTVLNKKIFNYLNTHAISDLITYIHAAETGKKEIAALAPLCFEAADEGDTAAAECIKKAAKDLFLLIQAVVHQLNLDHFPLLLRGSTITKGIMLREHLINLLQSADIGFTLCDSSTDAARAAALMAVSVDLNHNKI